MARITGKNGQLKIGSNVIASITDWTLDAKIPTSDATAMGDDWAVKLSGIREWSGEISGHYENSSGNSDLISSFFAATAASGGTGGVVTIHLYPDAAAAENWNGSAYIDVALGVNKDKPNSFKGKFQGTGALATS